MPIADRAMPATSPDPVARRSRPASLPQVRAEHILTIMVGAAVVLAFLVRAAHVLRWDFPLNDGGMFALMIEEIRHAHYRLPSETAYNFSHIPFAYPPLALYAAALVADLTRLGVPDVLRLLPLAVSTVTVLALLRLTRGFLNSRLALATACVVFAVMPSGFIYLIMGGGLTRSFGFLFAILAISEMHRLYQTGERRFMLTATLAAGGTVLSHLGTVPFLVQSLALLWLFYGRTPRTLLMTVGVLCGAAAVAAPWWAPVVATHGLAPFIAAQSTGGSILSDPDARRGLLGLLARLGLGSWTATSTGEALFPLLGTLGLLGAVVCVVDRQLFLPVWWLTILVFNTRAGLTFASVPVAMLAGLGVSRGLIPILLPHFRRPAQHDVEHSMTSWRTWPSAAWATLGFIILYASAASLLEVAAYGSDLRYLSSLLPSERAAMRQAAAMLPPDSRVLVIPDGEWTVWAVDKSSEWFPVLASRQSVATVQGSEWLPNGTFARKQNLSKALRQCAAGISDCLDDWSRNAGIAFSHVYIPQPPLPAEEAYRLCCKLLIASLRNDSRYTLMYDGPGAMIFARRDANLH